MCAGSSGGKKIKSGISMCLHVNMMLQSTEDAYAQELDAEMRMPAYKFMNFTSMRPITFNSYLGKWNCDFMDKLLIVSKDLNTNLAGTPISTSFVRCGGVADRFDSIYGECRCVYGEGK